MSKTTLIRSGIVVNADCSERADVLVRNRKIIAVGVGLKGDATIGAGRPTKEEFVAATSTNIAKILNMYPRKGVVRAGADADIVIWDPKGTKTITHKKQFSRIDYNVFEGTVCAGVPRTVISRGNVAFEQGDMRAKAGDGDFVARKANAPVHVANAIWKGVTQPKGVERIEVVP